MSVLRRARAAMFVPMAVALAIAIVAFGASANAAPREIAATVTAVASGDTLTIVDEAGVRYKVRLADIEAPQGAEYYAPAAKALLAGMVEGKRVRVAVTGERAPDSLYARVGASATSAGDRRGAPAAAARPQQPARADPAAGGGPPHAERRATGRAARSVLGARALARASVSRMFVSV
jgi:hypothetical protein